MVTEWPSTPWSTLSQRCVGTSLHDRHWNAANLSILPWPEPVCLAVLADSAHRTCRLPAGAEEEQAIVLRGEVKRPGGVHALEGGCDCHWQTVSGRGADAHVGPLRRSSPAGSTAGTGPVSAQA